MFKKRHKGELRSKAALQTLKQSRYQEWQREINQEFIKTQQYVILRDAGFDRDQACAIARAILHSEQG